MYKKSATAEKNLSHLKHSLHKLRLYISNFILTHTKKLSIVFLPIKKCPLEVGQLTKMNSVIDHRIEEKKTSFKLAITSFNNNYPF